MKVWTVFLNDYDGFWAEAIFTTKELAEAARDRKNAKSGKAIYEIEEYELDKEDD